MSMVSIHDPIHGTIEVSLAEMKLIDSRAFQRLRHIKQLGFAELAFPGATHTRYAHRDHWRHCESLSRRRCTSIWLVRWYDSSMVGIDLSSSIVAMPSWDITGEVPCIESSHDITLSDCYNPEAQRSCETPHQNDTIP